MRKKILLILICCTVIFTFGCASQMSEYKIFCGMSCPDGNAVSIEQWENFTKEFIIPEFPEGFTVLNGNGYWQDNKGKIINEDAKIILVIAEDSIEIESKISRIAQAYRQHYHQECVIVLKSKSKVTFID